MKKFFNEFKTFISRGNVMDMAIGVVIATAFSKISASLVADIIMPLIGCLIGGVDLSTLNITLQPAVMEGETVTGVTSMYMAEGLDTGDMLLTEEVAIAPDDNFEAVHDKLGAAGARVLLRTVDAAKHGDLHPIKQNDADSTYAAKIEKAECLVDWTWDAKRLHDKIRGLSPFPLAYTTLPGGKLFKIVRAHPESESASAPAGTVIAADKSGIKVACGSGVLVIDAATPEGKKAQSAADLVNGRQIAVGAKLG